MEAEGVVPLWSRSTEHPMKYTGFVWHWDFLHLYICISFGMRGVHHDESIIKVMYKSWEHENGFMVLEDKEGETA